MHGLPFTPVVSDWFSRSFDAPTPAQLESWENIQAGRDVLIAAPTGSGKTLAAFLAGINQLVRRAQNNELEDQTYIIYISPLKALSNDVRKNLEIPMAAISEAAGGLGIRTGLRTGDTPASVRQKMTKLPPHILVTTPESLYLMLTAEKSRHAIRHLETIIVDEIHAIAGSKRGAHLALSLERLDRLTMQNHGAKVQRVGVSATQKPIELIARMLVGHSRQLPHIVDSGHARDIDLQIEITDDELAAVASGEQMGRTYDRVAELVSQHNTTLVFVNTRKLVERVSHALAERLGEEQVVAHHGSISRKLRYQAEQKLKTGQVKCAVATASLELGIDVGDVDLVVQMGSPRSIAVLLQRIGRAGHTIGATPKGRLFAHTRDQLVECAALVRAIRKGNLDAVVPSRMPLDILSQQIVAASACEELSEDDVFKMFSSAYHYGDLTRKEFDDVIEVLAKGFASKRRGAVGARIFRDRVGGTISGRKGARLISLTCGGAIPDTANYPVVLQPDNVRVGSLDEEFAIESLPGDIFLLGNTSWRIQRVSEGKVFVHDAKGAPPNIPFWFGEAPARTEELSDEVGKLRQWFFDRYQTEGLPLDAIVLLASQEIQVSAVVAKSLVDYLAAGFNTLGAMPTQKRVVVERFFDEGGGMQLVLHAPFGGRVNRGWGLALRKKFCRSFNFELQAAATDDGIIISLGEPHSFPLEDVAKFLNPEKAEEVLIQAMLDSAFFEARWRWNATRSLAVPRRYGGKKVPPHLLRMRCDDLLSVVFPMAQACLENVVGDIVIPDHPIVKQTVDDCLHEAMDVDGLTAVLLGIKSGGIEFVGKDTVEPSLFAHEIVNANPYAFLDDTPLEERRTRAVSLRRGIGDPNGSALAIDSNTVSEVVAAAKAKVRDYRELLDWLVSDIVVPPNDEYMDLMSELIASGKAAVLQSCRSKKDFWVAAEMVCYAKQVYGSAVTTSLKEVPFEQPKLDREEVVRRIIHSYLSRRGPQFQSQIAEALDLDSSDVAIGLAALAADGAAFAGKYTAQEEQWCERHILAKLHKRTLRRLRKSIEPVSPTTVMRFLFAWQRVTPSHQTAGAEGLETVVQQLQGFHAATTAWEKDLLPSRLIDYSPETLDKLCMAGVVSWSRLVGGAHKTPGKTAPITLMLREERLWLRTAYQGELSVDLSAQASLVGGYLAENGASFLRDIVEELKISPSEAEASLWELVSCGLVSADGFSAIRSLLGGDKTASRFDKTKVVSGKSRKWSKAVRRARGRDFRRSSTSRPAAAGRWSLLASAEQSESDVVGKVAMQLLTRYGILFRDLIMREQKTVPWRDIVSYLFRLEARGEIRSGHFVSGFVGPQFALPEALTMLRRHRKSEVSPAPITISACDPLNLVGVLFDGPKIKAHPKNQVIFLDGSPIGAVESGKVIDLKPTSPAAIELCSGQEEIQSELFSGSL